MDRDISCFHNLSGMNTWQLSQYEPVSSLKIHLMETIEIVFFHISIKIAIAD